MNDLITDNLWFEYSQWEKYNLRQGILYICSNELTRHTIVTRVALYINFNKEIDLRKALRKLGEIPEEIVENYTKLSNEVEEYIRRTMKHLLPSKLKR